MEGSFAPVEGQSSLRRLLSGSYRWPAGLDRRQPPGLTAAVASELLAGIAS